MKLLWRGAWIETPGYEVPDSGVLISVAAAVPLVRMENASGRLTRRPGRKVATFLLTDGPARTLRKARTKRDEPRFTGDFRVSWSSARSSGLATARWPWLRAFRLLPSSWWSIAAWCSRSAETFSADDLQGLAARLLTEADVLGRLGRQGFLYSGMEPPAELVRLLATALRAGGQAFRGTIGGGGGGSPAPRRRRASGGHGSPAEARGGSPGIPVAVLGAGDYTRTEIIPALRKANLSLYSVANREPQIAAMVGREYGFALATTDSERAIAELPAPGLVVVATAHDSHAHLACAALKAGHRVFVEKPPAVTPEDVHHLAAGMRCYPGAVEIGFNRRYHPLVRRARARLWQETGPTSISCTVKELAFEPDHWYFWPNQGTRITGNLCHWIDLAVFLIEGSPLPVSLTLSPRHARNGTRQ